MVKRILITLFVNYKKKKKKSPIKPIEFFFLIISIWNNVALNNNKKNQSHVAENSKAPPTETI